METELQSLVQSSGLDPAGSGEMSSSTRPPHQTDTEGRMAKVLPDLVLRSAGAAEEGLAIPPALVDEEGRPVPPGLADQGVLFTI